MAEKKLEDIRLSLELPGATVEDDISILSFGSDDGQTDSCLVTFSEELFADVNGTDATTCLMQMSCGEDYADLIEGAGEWREEQKQLMIRGPVSTLQGVPIRNTFLGCHPQEIVRYILIQAGVETFELSEAEYEKRQVVPIDEQDAVAALLRVNNIWQIDVPFFFRGGVFYWGIRPEQAQTYELDDGNILGLEKEGDTWTADILPVPWIRPGDYVVIDHEELTAVGDVKRVVIQASSTGSCDMYLTFKEVPEEDG